MKQLPTYEEVSELLEYNPETGLFRWNNPPSVRCKKGWFAGTDHNQGYKRIKIMGKDYLAHRLAWLLYTGDWPSQSIDHIDGCRSNNALSNLRDVSHSDNLSNMQQAKGWRKHGNRYQATAKLDSIERHIGYFDTSEEASIAYWSVKNISGLNPNYKGPTYA